MSEISYFNPLKNYHATNVNDFLFELATKFNREVCFYDDDGYYFSSARRLGNVSLCVTCPKYYNFFALLKNDMYLTKIAFERFFTKFEWALIDHFEERYFSETDPFVLSFILLCLNKLSDNPNGDFSNYNKKNLPSLVYAIENLDMYRIDNEIYHNELPEGCFVISYEKEFEDREGVLLTTSVRSDYTLVRNLDGINIYYVKK